MKLKLVLGVIGILLIVNQIINWSQIGLIGFFLGGLMLAASSDEFL